MKKCPVTASLYYYNKSKKAHKEPEKQYCSLDYLNKDTLIEQPARKSFFLAYFASRNNK